jgi:hypothetical protein
MYRIDCRLQSIAEAYRYAYCEVYTWLEMADLSAPTRMF